VQNEKLACWNTCSANSGHVSNPRTVGHVKKKKKKKKNKKKKKKNKINNKKKKNKKQKKN